MGRAGGGTHHSGGGSVGGGHHSGGSISGGHRISSGSRAGRGLSSGSHTGGRPSGGATSRRNGGFGRTPKVDLSPSGMPRRVSGDCMGPTFTPPPPPPRHTYVNAGPSYTYVDSPPRGRRKNGCLTVVLILCFVTLLVCVLGILKNSYSSSGKIAASTIVRTKLDDSHAYRTGNVIDDLGWFDSVNSTEKGLKQFYEETGIQPYIYLKSYDSSLTTDQEKEAWAKNYFDTELDDSDGFLFIYFAEEDTDGDIGFMSYVAGSRAQSVMDTEVVGIFWGYIDRYWPTDLSTDEVILKSFNGTANAIMHVSTTSNDIAMCIIIGIIALGGGIIILRIIRIRRKNEKERAEETERILNTPLEKEKDSTDVLIDKYQ